MNDSKSSRKNNHSNVFKLVIALPSAVVVGFLLSAVLVRIVHSPDLDFDFDLATPDYRPILTTRGGQPLADRSYGIRLALDPYTLYRNLPNQQNRTFSIDEHGFRRHRTNQSAPTAFVLGGSAAFGQGLRPGEIPFSELIDERLENVQLYNASVIGYVSGQELAMMCHHLVDFKPDLYIVYDGWNDLYAPFAGVDSWPAPDSLVGVQPTFFEIESRLLEKGPRGVEKPVKERRFREPKNSGLLGERDFFAAIAAEYSRNLELMAAVASAGASSIVVVFQPELAHKGHPSFSEQAQLEHWNQRYGYLDREFPVRYSELVSTAAARCRELGIPYVNLLDSDIMMRSEETLFADAVHLNQRGHQLVANEILEFLESSGIN